MNIHNTICQAANSYRSGKMKSTMPTQAEFEKVLASNWQREEVIESLVETVEWLERILRCGAIPTKTSAHSMADKAQAAIKKARGI